MADMRVLTSAQAVDEITQSEWRKANKSIPLPIAERIIETSEKLHFFYGVNRPDGRIVASRFLDYLVDTNPDYQFARPPALDDDNFLQSFA